MTPAELARRTAEGLHQADARGLNASLSWSTESLEAEARRLETLAGERALAGMAVAIKDNIVTRDAPTTCECQS